MKVLGCGRSHYISVFLPWCGEGDLGGVLSSGIHSSTSAVVGCVTPQRIVCKTLVLYGSELTLWGGRESVVWLDCQSS